MPTPEKEAEVTEVAEIFKKAKSVFVTDYQGLNVENLSEFRQRCREASVHYCVVKNTLARLAAQKVGWDQMLEYFQGPSALAYSYEDASAPARIISEFTKTAEKPTIKVTLFEGIFYGPDRVQEIASLPPKPILLAKILGGLNAPIQGLVVGLNGLLQKLVMTLDAVKSTKEETEK